MEENKSQGSKFEKYPGWAWEYILRYFTFPHEDLFTQARSK